MEQIVIEAANQGARSSPHDPADNNGRNPHAEVQLKRRVEAIGDNDKFLTIFDQARNLERGRTHIEEDLLPRMDERCGRLGDAPFLRKLFLLPCREVQFEPATVALFEQIRLQPEGIYRQRQANVIPNSSPVSG